MADPDALISVDILIVNPRSPSDEQSERMQIISIQFNSLDVIANQETIVELISFARRVMPDPAQLSKKRKMPTKEIACQTDDHTSTLSRFSLRFDTLKSSQEQLNFS